MQVACQRGSLDDNAPFFQVFGQFLGGKALFPHFDQHGRKFHDGILEGHFAICPDGLGGFQPGQFGLDGFDLVIGKGGFHSSVISHNFTPFGWMLP